MARRTLTEHTRARPTGSLPNPAPPPCHSRRARVHRPPSGRHRRHSATQHDTAPAAQPEDVSKASNRPGNLDWQRRERRERRGRRRRRQRHNGRQWHRHRRRRSSRDHRIGRPGRRRRARGHRSRRQRRHRSNRPTGLTATQRCYRTTQPIHHSGSSDLGATQSRCSIAF